MEVLISYLLRDAIFDFVLIFSLMVINGPFFI